MSEKSQRSAAAILADLEKATKVLVAAQNAEKNAASSRATAMNTVNRLQKEYDDAVDRIRAEAPPDTDWRRTQNRRVHEEDR